MAGPELGRISGPLLAKNLQRYGVDLAFETDLLYLDVVNGRIGINSDGPTRDLLINENVKSTNLIVDNRFDIPDFTISLNRIQQANGTIYIRPDQLSNPTVVTTKLATDNLNISDKLIENITTNSNIELSPNGLGEVQLLTSRLDISQNLHSTGNITLDGNVTFGYDENDNVYFVADIGSNMVPDGTDTYDLGSTNKRWRTVYTHNLVSTNITSNNITVNDINLLLTQGNTWYVSVNGNDTYYGDHQHSTFRTLKKALSVAQSGDQVVVFPGTYSEDFPLTVPQGVSINGAGIRSVAIIPTEATKSKDAFLLNGETTIENLSVNNFYYDSVNNTGYAFRFAPNVKVTTRSPYIRNVTIITKIDTLPAGHGALVDGSVADATSNEASMLFHAVTMIIPNAEGITATNGARVEWLNSFTYYANRGIHLTEGTLGFASLGVRFGAEMRSINSANVYGNYGAVADGPSTLGYLIGHNFGFVGTGLNDVNDRGLVIQANEVEEYNGGHIYYDSMDHKGDYRIGDIFYVNQETGQVSFNADAIDFGALGSITLESPSSTTIINKDYVQTGNIRVFDNNIISLAGPVNFSAASGSTYLNTNVLISADADVTGNIIVHGDVTLGNEPGDIIIIAPEITEHVLPEFNNTFELGSNSKRWNTLYSTLIDVDGVTQIYNNEISTLVAGTDLTFIAAGTGIIRVEFDNVEIDQSLTVDKILTVNGLTSLRDTEVTGTITQTGNIVRTGITDITGNVSNTNTVILGDSYFNIPDIKIYNNVISAEATNSNLVFIGSGTGGVKLDQYLTFKDNVITNTRIGATTNYEKSIVLTPNGSGDAVVNTTKSLILPIGNNTTRTLGSLGEIRYNSTTKLFEGWQPSGLVSFKDLYDSDRNTYITAELTPGTNDNIIRFGINSIVKGTIDSTALKTNTLHIDNINISGNIINNLVSSNDVNVVPTGTGSVVINDNYIKDNTITVNADSVLTFYGTGTGYVKFNGNNGTVVPVGGNLNEPTFSNTEIGQLRFNTDKGYLTVFDGAAWVSAKGTSEVLTQNEVVDILDIWTLILG